MLQLRKAKKRRRRSTQGKLHRAETFFDLVLGLLLGHLLAVEIGVRPGVRPDGMPGRGHLPENFRMIGGVLADRKKHRLGAFVGERLEYRWRIAWPRAVVKGQHDLLVGEKVELLEMFEAETRPARGVDFHHAAHAKRIRIGAPGFRLQGSGRQSRGSKSSRRQSSRRFDSRRRNSGRRYRGRSGCN